MEIDGITKKYPILKGVVDRIKEVDKICSLFSPQADAIKSGYLEGKNLVLAIPTCSGKTMLSELAMLKTILEKGKKAIYLVPLKALAMEKYREFKEKYEPLGVRVAVSIGDYDKSDNWLSKFDIIITSNEKCDSLLRHEPLWVSDIGIIVSDEVHLLDDVGRGPTLEMVLARLKTITNAQILALSATIKNNEELADWLEAKTIKSKFRPVKLYKGVCFDGKLRFIPKKTFKLSSGNPLFELVMKTMSKGKQVLVFVNTRRGSESAAEKIGKHIKNRLKPGETEELSELSRKLLSSLEHHTKQCERLAECVKTGTAFHHAGLVARQRSLIEEAFRKGLIKVITATPTLCLDENTDIWNGMSNKKASDMANIKRVFVLKDSRLKEVGVQTINELNPPKYMIKLTASGGNHITLTGNHKILLKRNGRRLLLKACECGEKDKIASVGRLPFKNVKINKWGDFVKSNKLPFEDCILDKDVYYMIGVFLGDGYSGAEIINGKIRYKGSPAVVGEDSEVFKRIKSVCNKYRISHKMGKNYYGTPQLVFSKSKWFREFLSRCGIDKGVKKHIPIRLSEADNESLRCLLQGLFDTDGYVQSKGIVGFSNISFRLIEGLKKSLLRFGIVSWSRKRASKGINIYGKSYKTKNSKELLITHSKCIETFQREIGFNIQRKRDVLETVTRKQDHLHLIKCKRCGYTLHVRMFTGRTKSQKKWGMEKKEIIRVLGERGEMGSRELTKTSGFIPRKCERRLNHHYELISKRKYGANEWLWRLNELGSWVYGNLIKKGMDMCEYFKNHSSCPLCGKAIVKEARKTWKSKDFEDDIYWDRIRAVEEVANSSHKVYDVVLSGNTHDHLFAANGFLVHNSFGLNLPSNTVIIRDLKRFSSFRGMDFLTNLEIEQMCGRAGRIKYDSEGFAILLPKSKAEARYAWDSYVKGDPEDIKSKLGVEPVLRMHVLALIASGVVTNRKELMEFFSKTFYAHQYKDLQALEKILGNVLELLGEFRFITMGSGDEESEAGSGLFKSASSLLEREKEELKPTRIGKRVSELYIDPLTANHFIKSLEKAGKPGRELTHLALLHTIANTIEMRPLLNLRKKDFETIDEAMAAEEANLLDKPPSAWDLEYDDYLRSFKTSLMLRSWTRENGEDQILELFGVTPGELRARLERTDWLLYSIQELCLLLGQMDLLKRIRKSRVRVRYGVRAELLPLVRLKGIGRARARVLYNSNVKSLKDLRTIPLKSLERLVGVKTAQNVKEQLGELNDKK